MVTKLCVCFIDSLPLLQSCCFIATIYLNTEWWKIQDPFLFGFAWKFLEITSLGFMSCPRLVRVRVLSYQSLFIRKIMPPSPLHLISPSVPLPSTWINILHPISFPIHIFFTRKLVVLSSIPSPQISLKLPSAYLPLSPSLLPPYTPPPAGCYERERARPLHPTRLPSPSHWEY